MKIIDLSVTLNEDTPVYPGDPKFKIGKAGVLEKDGFNDHYISGGTHVGTHIDAPLHMVDNGKNLDEIPIGQFAGRGIYIKVDNKTFDIATVENAGIEEGDIVLFHTGMADIYDSEEYFENYPEIPEVIARYLADKKVKMVGVDMCGPDHEPFKIHKILLGSGVLIIENLTNLGQLEGKEFNLYALPIKLQLDGGPARVIAEVL